MYNSVIKDLIDDFLENLLKSNGNYYENSLSALSIDLKYLSIRRVEDNTFKQCHYIASNINLFLVEYFAKDFKKSGLLNYYDVLTPFCSDRMELIYKYYSSLPHDLINSFNPTICLHKTICCLLCQDYANATLNNEKLREYTKKKE
jgi:hypothetical protein